MFAAIKKWWRGEKAPVLRSRYRDSGHSGQLVIVCSVEFGPDVFDEQSHEFVMLHEGVTRRVTVRPGESTDLKESLAKGARVLSITRAPVHALPVLSGNTVVFTRLKPDRLLVCPCVEVTYMKDGVPDETVIAAGLDASDLLLTGGFSGSLNVFPNAPGAETGINCSAFQSNAVGVTFSWPMIQPGVSVTIQMLVERSIMRHVNYVLPASATKPERSLGTEGYKVRKIKVVANVAMFGPQIVPV